MFKLQAERETDVRPVTLGLPSLSAAADLVETLELYNCWPEGFDAVAVQGERRWVYDDGWTELIDA